LGQVGPAHDRQYDRRGKGERSANSPARLLPGTIYNYGPDAFPTLREESPQNAATRKGKIRIELEKKLKDASRQGVRSLIVRFGDFFGPKPGGNWFSQAMVTPNRPLTSITYPGESGVAHEWAYVPDAGEVFAELMDREVELEAFACFHFRGFLDKDGTEMIAAIRRVTGKPSLPVKKLPWFFFKLAAPFNETLRETAANRPLWTTPIELDNTQLVRCLGKEPQTDLDRAVETTLRALGCLAK
jgi:nucleoside-diphosphate-sugar epimerase